MRPWLTWQGGARAAADAMVGDLDAARVAHEALGKLLASAAASTAGDVVDLGSERNERRNQKGGS